MLTPFLSKEQQGIVMFWWLGQSLGYWKRMLISFGCIFSGFALQFVFPSLWFLGIMPFLFIGTLFLAVRGYDNRVKFGKYSANDAWEQVDQQKIREVEDLVEKMRKWDRSMLDISNTLGKFVFVVLVLLLLALYILSPGTMGKVLAADAAILLFPHWFTGKREILTQPRLLLKIQLMDELLQQENVKERLHNATLDYFLLLKGQQTKVPEDVKFRIEFPNQHPEFLGCYGQIVTNSVQSKVYPYFYVVMVAKKNYGLKQAFDAYVPSRKIVKEYKEEGDVEVLVIRQKTTRTSGYHTNHRAMRHILLEGVNVAEQAAVK